MLAEAAAAAGADADAARAFLASEEGYEGIRRSQTMLREMGVNGIPTFILGGRRVLPSGAMHAEGLERELRVLEAEPGGAPETLFGEALGFSAQVLQQTLELGATADGRA